MASPARPSSQELADRTSSDRSTSRVIDPKFLELLVCPVTRTPLDYDAVRQELISRAAQLAYPIRDGIPIMLVDGARRIES